MHPCEAGARLAPCALPVTWWQVEFCCPPRALLHDRCAQGNEAFRDSDYTAAYDLYTKVRAVRVWLVPC